MKRGATICVPRRLVVRKADSLGSGPRRLAGNRDAEADGGELTENERRRNEKAHDWSGEVPHKDSLQFGNSRRLIGDLLIKCIL
ncbi:hypothetical protein SRHO_G00044470 [Serrasalmus rhombeus]